MWDKTFIWKDHGVMKSTTSHSVRNFSHRKWTRLSLKQQDKTFKYVPVSVLLCCFAVMSFIPSSLYLLWLMIDALVILCIR